MPAFVSEFVLEQQRRASAEIEACRVSAEQSQRAFDVDITDVETTWNPTGFYTPEQLKQIMLLAFAVTNEADKALKTARQASQLEFHREFLRAGDEAQILVQRDSQPFLDALARAKAEGFQIIESTGLKRWVVRMLKAARQGRFAVVMVACDRPGFLRVLDVLAAAVEKFVAFVKTVGGVAVAVAKAAVGLVLKIPDLLGSFVTFLKFLPWVALLAGGYYVGVKTELIPPKYDPLKLRGAKPWKPWKPRAQPTEPK